MRRGVAGVAVSALLLLSGCAEEDGTDPGLTPDPSTLGPATIDDYLANLTHLRVPLNVELGWNAANASHEAPLIVTSLVFFPFASNVSDVNFDPEAAPLLVAFIPIGFPETVNACGAAPASVAAYPGLWEAGGGGFGQGGGGGNDGPNYVEGLTNASYGPGWYHVVFVANATVRFSITFGEDDSPPERSMPAGNPFIEAIVDLRTGAREHTFDLPSESPWAVWSNFEVDQTNMNQDGGYTVELSIGTGCVTNTATNMNAFFFGNQRRARAAAAGSANPLSIAASYTPTVAPSAAASATVTSVVVWTSPVTLPEPQA